MRISQHTSHVQSYEELIQLGVLQHVHFNRTNDDYAIFIHDIPAVKQWLGLWTIYKLGWSFDSLHDCLGMDLQSAIEIFIHRDAKSHRMRNHDNTWNVWYEDHCYTIKVQDFYSITEITKEPDYEPERN